MGYLICDKCRGYYELQEGESPEDFESCECGGTLKYVENSTNTIQKLKQKPILMECPLCGTENPENAQFCASCGNNLSKENAKTVLRAEKVSKLQKKYKKPKTSPNRTWYKNKFSIALLLVVLILVSMAIYLVNISNNTSSDFIVPQNIQSSNSNSASSTQTQSSAGDYNSGYDEGYFNGVNEAYSGWEYDEGVSSKFSDLYRQGYKDGYKQGYNDIKNNRALEKPKTSGTAILDPRTGEKIYS